MIKKIGICGFGIMALGIATFFAQKKIPVMIWGHDKALLQKTMKQLQKKKELKKAKIEYTYEIEDLSSCDLIIEAIVENKSIKKRLFKQLSKKIFKKQIIASNTSSLSITDLGKAYHDPSKFLGMHFMNPAEKLPLVEVIKGKKTSTKTITQVKSFLEKHKKVPIVVKDHPGFVVNNILFPMMNSAMHLADKKITSFQEIDLMMKTLGFPMGPFELADFVGLDVCLSILKNVKEKPAKVLLDKIKKGHLGRKTGKGFYKYKRNR